MQTCAAVKAVASKRAMSVKRNLSESCKFCNCCFKVKFGNMSQPGKQGYLFSENLFEPSSKNITEFLNFVGIELPKDPTALSQHVCNPCDRKTRNLHHLYEFVRGSIRLPVLPNWNWRKWKRFLATPKRIACEFPNSENRTRQIEEIFNVCLEIRDKFQYALNINYFH